MAINLPLTLMPMDFITIIQNRYSCRAFSPSRVEMGEFVTKR